MSKESRSGRNKHGRYVPGLKKWSSRSPEPALFHVTNRFALEDIRKHGLQPDLGELTQDAFIRQRSESYHEDLGLNSQRAIDRASRDLDKLPGYVFAAEKDDLPVAIRMIGRSWMVGGTPIKDLVVLGITGGAAKNFRDEEIASPIDRVSEKPVPPSKLRRMPDEFWKKIARGD